MNHTQIPIVIALPKHIMCNWVAFAISVGNLFMEQKNETWKDIIGYEGLYMVSDNGRIKSLSRKIKHPKGPKKLSEKILKPLCLMLAEKQF